MTNTVHGYVTAGVIEEEEEGEGEGERERAGKLQREDLSPSHKASRLVTAVHLKRETNTRH